MKANHFHFWNFMAIRIAFKVVFFPLLLYKAGGVIFEAQNFLAAAGKTSFISTLAA